MRDVKFNVAGALVLPAPRFSVNLPLLLRRKSRFGSRWFNNGS
jgi:hypothetical protein